MIAIDLSALHDLTYDSLKFAITVFAKSQGIHPELALLIVGCVAVLVITALMSTLAKMIVSISTILRVGCQLVLVCLAGLVAMSVASKVWRLPEVQGWLAMVGLW